MDKGVTLIIDPAYYTKKIVRPEVAAMTIRKSQLEKRLEKTLSFLG